MGNKEDGEGEEVLHNNVQQHGEGSRGEGSGMRYLPFECEALICFCVFCT